MIFISLLCRNGVVNLSPKAKAMYAFINRGNHPFSAGFASEFRKSVEAMAGLKLNNQEKDYLAAPCPYLSPVYLDFLQGYCYNPDEVQ